MVAGGRVVVDAIVVTLGRVVIVVSTTAATVDGVVAASVLRLQIVKAMTPVRAPPMTTTSNRERRDTP
jgi:hypothetical protein